MASHQLHSSDLQPRALGSLWIGPELGPLEQLCLLSFLEHGHDITLYTYGPVAGIPPGVGVADAREVFDVGTILRHKKTKSLTLHSDFFRYALLAKTSRMWVDLDLFCLQPFIFSSPYVFGTEYKDSVNNAALALPADSEILQHLLSYQPGDKGYPPYFTLGRKLRYFIKHGGRKPDISEWPWGAIGPHALTYHLKQTGEIDNVMPVQTFYPVSLAIVSNLSKADSVKREDFSSDVFAVHLWGSQLRKLLLTQHQGRFPDRSFLQLEMARLSQKFDFNMACLKP